MVENTSSDKNFRPGHPWGYHYRGTKYHFDSERRIWWKVPDTGDRVLARAGHKQLAEDLLKVRPEGGSFRITETGAVLTMNQENTPDWHPIYVGELVETLEFEHVDVVADGRLPLDLWPAFYDGARYSFRGNKIWWHDAQAGLRHYVNESLPADLQGRLSQLKVDGGTFRVTEHGKVITLINPQPLPPRLKTQLAAMTPVQQRLLKVKYEATEMIPVYVGDYVEGFTLSPAKRITDPLSKKEQLEIVSFLKQYNQDIDPEEAFQDFHDDRPEGLP